MSETPFDTQELQYPSDFSTPSSVLMIVKIYKRKYQP